MDNRTVRVCQGQVITGHRFDDVATAVYAFQIAVVKPNAFTNSKQNVLS